ncbi:MAG: hypothetical protein JXR37_30490 [Kiritimatiellae bacterium]|nr:hypothetical protein [Kiritimatiellia bacterium]
MSLRDRVATLADDFRRSLEADRLGHAYILVGDPRGEGRELAEDILQLLFCAAPGKPCGQCRPCVQAAQRTHPDLLWLEPRKKSRTILIEQIRALEHRMLATSFMGGWKACVLESADRMGQEASNAFLKTLEEPAGRSMFLLLTDSPQSLLATITSRCQRVLISSEQGRIPHEWRGPLVDIFRVAGAGGTLDGLAAAKRLLAFLDERRKAVEQEEAEASAAAGLDEDPETLDARVWARYKAERTAVLRAMLRWHRDVMLCLCEGDDDLLHFSEFAGELKAQAARLDCRQALANVSRVEEMDRQLEANLPEEAVIEHGLIGTQAEWLRVKG